MEKSRIPSARTLPMFTTRFGSLTCQGRSATLLNAVNRLVFTPIANPSPSKATNVNPGCFRIDRTPYAASRQRLSSHGQIHTPRASSRAYVALPHVAGAAPECDSIAR